MAKYVIIVDDKAEYLKSFTEIGGVTAEWGEIDWFTQAEGDAEEVASDAVVFEDLGEAERVAKVLNEVFRDPDPEYTDYECMVQEVNVVSKYRFVQS